MNNSVIRFPEVKSRCGISHSNIYNQINQGTFPKPIRLGERAVGWLSSEIDDWLSRKAEERLQHPSKKAIKGKLLVVASHDSITSESTPIVPTLPCKELK
jgi:prophage regulatory protein